jgi:hypothetical protein
MVPFIFEKNISSENLSKQNLFLECLLKYLSLSLLSLFRIKNVLLSLTLVVSSLRSLLWGR